MFRCQKEQYLKHPNQPIKNADERCQDPKYHHKLEKATLGVMLNFMSPCLGYKAPGYLVKHYFECSCEGVFG